MALQRQTRHVKVLPRAQTEPHTEREEEPGLTPPVNPISPVFLSHATKQSLTDPHAKHVTFHVPVFSP